MTTYYPISFTVPQYEDSSGLPYSGAVLKAYVAGTSTPLSLATDYTGATTSATATLNAAGYPTVSGNVIIPHFSENYKLSLYPTAAAATANTGAIWTVDNNQISQFSTATRLINQATDTGAADAYVIAPGPAIAAYAVGQIVTLLPVNANTAASTLTVSGLATKDIKRIDGSALTAGDMLTTGISILIYNGTNFILTNPKNVVLSDTTVGDVSTTKHGYAPKGTNIGNFLKDTGSYAATVSSVTKQVFTGSGTYTPTTGMLYCIVEAVGGGGGSGGAASNNYSGGGGGGGYARAVLTAAQIGASQAVTIGTAGTAGSLTGPTAGGNGGTTSLGALLSTNGGTASGTGTGAAVAQGGAGGTGITGDLLIQGETGAGHSSHNIYLTVAGKGGNSFFGYGGAAQYTEQSNFAGLVGTGYGAGASGCVAYSAAQNGAAGTAGVMFITEYIK